MAKRVSRTKAAALPQHSKSAIVARFSKPRERSASSSGARVSANEAYHESSGSGRGHSAFAITHATEDCPPTTMAKRVSRTKAAALPQHSKSAIVARFSKPRERSTPSSGTRVSTNEAYRESTGHGHFFARHRTSDDDGPRPGGLVARKLRLCRSTPNRP